MFPAPSRIRSATGRRYLARRFAGYGAMPALMPERRLFISMQGNLPGGESGDSADRDVGDRVVLNVRHRCYPNKISEYPEDCDLGEIEICLFYSTAPTHKRLLRQLNYRLDGYEVKRVLRLSDVFLPLTQKPVRH